jgi:7-cyano-7-deazaguanine synthase
MSNSVALLLSGGCDSSSMAYYLVERGEKVLGLTLLNHHNGDNSQEVQSAKLVADSLGIQHKIVDISSLGSIFSQSSNYQISLGGVSSCLPTSKTMAPASVEIMMSIAASFALSHNCSDLYWAVHKEDLDGINRSIFIDYVSSFSKAVSLRNTDNFNILLPFLDMAKSDVLKIGIKAGLNVANTFSCFNPTDIGMECGSCYKCLEKAKAFRLIEDSINRKFYLSNTN